jgi:MipA family protein
MLLGERGIGRGTVVSARSISSVGDPDDARDEREPEGIHMHYRVSRSSVPLFRTRASTKGRIARNTLRLLFVLGAWGLSSAVAQAQMLREEELEQQGVANQPVTGNWNVTLGAGVAGRPDYPGASGYRAEPIPLVLISYRDLFFLGPLGLGMNAINWNGFRAGPVLGYEGGRNQSDDSRLDGLGDIQPSATAGLFAGYHDGPFAISATARQAIIHTSNGLDGLVWLDYRAAIVSHSLSLAIGPDVEFADSQYDRTWFGVTPGQSALSGLPVFTPGGGVRDVGLHAVLTYHYSEHILVVTFATVRELIGDVSDSPIVESKTQGLAGMGVAYHF